MAIGAIQAIEEYGLKPGVDIQIVSLDAARLALQAIIETYRSNATHCWAPNSSIWLSKWSMAYQSPSGFRRMRPFSISPTRQNLSTNGNIKPAHSQRLFR
jgi:hypothetical protein